MRRNLCNAILTRGIPVLITSGMPLADSFIIILFNALFYSNKVNYRERSLATLRSAIQENHPDNTPPPHRNETPLLIVDVKNDGNIQIKKKHSCP